MKMYLYLIFKKGYDNITKIDEDVGDVLVFLYYIGKNIEKMIKYRGD